MNNASRTLAQLSSGEKGTSRYLAYELLKGQADYNAQTDVWAFGMTVFVSISCITSSVSTSHFTLMLKELVNRRRPYEGRSDIQAMAAILDRGLPPLPPSISSLEARAFEICRLCWQFNPSNRPVMSNIVERIEAKPHWVVTTAAAQASERRRRTEPNFVCPVPGCGSTFTRHFNLKGISCMPLDLNSRTEDTSWC